MFYWLIELSNTVPFMGAFRTFLNVFRYITFRTGGAMVTGALFVFLFGPWIIDHLRIRQGKGQPIRTDGPQSHLLTKIGTPTMGGLMILSGLVVSTLLWANPLNPYVLIVLAVTLGFGFIAYLVGNAVFSDYLQINYVAGTGELAVLCGAVLGAGLGFLWFNAPPASIFMGDTGSLALGGMLGSIAVAVKHEIVLAVIGGLFVLEAVSVIVQVVSFKLTGKRVFRMAPLHHHFEQKGWTEPQIVIRFWIISVMLALAGLSTLKLR